MVGRLILIQPKEDENKEQKNLVEFRKNCTQIRQIEAKLKFIEHKEK